MFFTILDNSGQDFSVVIGLLQELHFLGKVDVTERVCEKHGVVDCYVHGPLLIGLLVSNHDFRNIVFVESGLNNNVVEKRKHLSMLMEFFAHTTLF